MPIELLWMPWNTLSEVKSLPQSLAATGGLNAHNVFIIGRHQIPAINCAARTRSRTRYLVNHLHNQIPPSYGCDMISCPEHCVLWDGHRWHEVMDYIILPTREGTGSAAMGIALHQKNLLDKMLASSESLKSHQSHRLPQEFMMYVVCLVPFEKNAYAHHINWRCISWCWFRLTANTARSYWADNHSCCFQTPVVAVGGGIYNFSLGTFNHRKQSRGIH